MVKGGSSSWLVPRLARGLLKRRCGGRRFNARRENSFRGETCERRRRFARGDARLDGRRAITKHAACRERVARAEGARSPTSCSQRLARARWLRVGGLLARARHASRRSRSSLANALDGPTQTGEVTSFVTSRARLVTRHEGAVIRARERPFASSVTSATRATAATDVVATSVSGIAATPTRRPDALATRPRRATARSPAGRTGTWA